MSKLVIVINGSGGVGKDTLCNIVSRHYKTVNVSSIDPIKRIARDNGWMGEKNEKTRKFLADLKELFINFNDLPLNYLLEKYSEFMDSDNQVLFMHIREPGEIKKLADRIPDGCKTLLVRGRNDRIRRWKNAADDEVEQYSYDYYYDNVKQLDELEQDFMPFFENIFNENAV